MSLSRIRTFRWVMTGLGLGAGALLLATGHTLVGVVIGGLALVRLVFLIGRERQRRRYRQLHTAAGGSYPVLRQLARGQFEVAARVIGTSSSDVRVEFANGRSIAEIATARGVPVRSVVAAVVADASAKLDRAVADGHTTPTAAERFRGRLPQWATRLVNRHRGDLRARPGMVT